MFEKIKNAFKTQQKAPEVTEKKVLTIPKSQYSFVEQYVITDPNRIMNGGYNLWGLCEFTPVACDNLEEESGWISSIQLPSVWVQSFLKQLKHSDPEIRKDPKQRLISVINMGNGHKLYIIPNLKEKKSSAILSDKCHDDKRKHDWVFLVTPEINRAIVEQAKIRSRG